MVVPSGVRFTRQVRPSPYSVLDRTSSHRQPNQSGGKTSPIRFFLFSCRSWLRILCVKRRVPAAVGVFIGRHTAPVFPRLDHAGNW